MTKNYQVGPDVGKSFEQLHVEQNHCYDRHMFANIDTHNNDLSFVSMISTWTMIIWAEEHGTYKSSVRRRWLLAVVHVDGPRTELYGFVQDFVPQIEQTRSNIPS